MNDLSQADLADPAQGFTNLALALDDLEASGHIQDDELAPDNKRVRIARTYLWLLGYLKDNNEKEQADKKFNAALALYRKEIGRSDASGPINEREWQLLIELAAFVDRPITPSTISEPALHPAVLRAAHVRLFSYALVTSKPNRDPSTFTHTTKSGRALLDALSQFQEVCLLLGIIKQPPPTQEELLQLLFNHTGIVQGLTPKGRGFAMFQPRPESGLSNTAAGKLSKRFIGNLALVELWLLGYETRPGTFRIDGPHASERSETLHKALKKFALDRNLVQASQRDIAIGAWFFEEAWAIQNKESDESAIDEHELDAVLTNHKSMRALEKQYKSLGARIIDGAKRALAWVISGIKKLAKTVVRVVRNIARAINAGASRIYRYLHDIFRVVGMGFDYLTSSPVPGSTPDTVLMHKYVDFDFDVVVNANAPRDNVTEFFEQLDLRVRALELGGQIIGQLWSVLRQVIRLTNAALGWLGLLMSLIKLGNWLRRMANLAQASRQLITEFDALDADIAPA